jgi:recombination protein RecA
MEVFATGYEELDSILEVGGYPRKKIVEIYGETDSGKSTILLKAIKEAIDNNLVVIYVDMDHKCNVEYMKNYLDMSKLFIVQPSSIEEGIVSVQKALEFDLVDLIIWDSLSSGESEKENSALPAYFRNLSQKLYSANATLIYTNQMRYNQIKKQHYVTYSKSITQLASIRIRLYKTETDGIIKAVVTTNKLGTPDLETLLEI